MADRARPAAGRAADGAVDTHLSAGSSGCGRGDRRADRGRGAVVGSRPNVSSNSSKTRRSSCASCSSWESRARSPTNRSQRYVTSCRTASSVSPRWKPSQRPAAKVIAASSKSVAFIQGSWGLDDAEGRAIRFAVGPEGLPLQDSEGPVFTVEGDGPLIEVLYTGTGFVVSRDGYLLTNRHVALPWDVEAPVEELAEQGLTPVIRRFIGYLPDMSEPFDMELVRASETLDVALLRCKPVGVDVQPAAARRIRRASRRRGHRHGLPDRGAGASRARRSCSGASHAGAMTSPTSGRSSSGWRRTT